MNRVTNERPVCLTIGGSDSCGGAGIQADLRVYSTLGAQGVSATTALTAQHPAQVVRIEPVSLAQLEAEIQAAFDYYDVAAVKTGMLLDAEHVALISGLLEQLHDGELVVDPVLISSSGRALLDDGGVDALIRGLMPQATLITPNFDEAERLQGAPCDRSDDALQALMERLGCAVLLTGGHGDGDLLSDRLCDREGRMHRFTHVRQPWSREQSHGSGCRLASAVAAWLSFGKPLERAVALAVEALDEGRLI